MQVPPAPGQPPLLRFAPPTAAQCRAPFLQAAARHKTASPVQPLETVRPRTLQIRQRAMQSQGREYCCRLVAPKRRQQRSKNRAGAKRENRDARSKRRKTQTILQIDTVS